jgi:hypothetical protein
MRPALIVLPLALFACGGKKAPAPEQPAEAAPAEEPLAATMPDTKEAKAFAGKLIETTVTDWQPISGSGAKFVYEELTFAPSGDWSAKGYVEASFEKIECAESGTWEIAEVGSASQATMVWTVGKTSCPMREAGASTRVLMDLPKAGSYEISFR